MTRLYVLIEGIVGEYIVGVFSSQEEAEKARDKLKETYFLKNPHIEWFDLGEIDPYWLETATFIYRT